MSTIGQQVAEQVIRITNEVSTQATQIEEIMTLLEGKTYDSTSLQPKVVTPTVVTQTITPDNGYEGLSAVTVNGDSDLVAENIKSGVNIFGVAGTYAGGESVETCSVTISYTNASQTLCSYTTYNDGDFDYIVDSEITSDTTLNNVMCNSFFIVAFKTSAALPRITKSDNVELCKEFYTTDDSFRNMFFRITSSAAATIQVSFLATEPT